LKQAVLNLYGLKICVAPSSIEACDLIWNHETVDCIASDDRPVHFTERRENVLWAHHVYGFPGEVACEFTVSPDGWTVSSRSRATFPEQDLLTLFAEPVMRSIFRARGITSFHGAALERDGRAILLLGAKEQVNPLRQPCSCSQGGHSSPTIWCASSQTAIAGLCHLVFAI
jgi:hypothetical protein